MPRNSYGLGVGSDVEDAFAQAATLGPGEQLAIVANDPTHASRLRKLFFKYRKRAQEAALAAGEADPNRADPWAGLMTTQEGACLTIFRPQPLVVTVTRTRADP